MQPNVILNPISAKPETTVTPASARRASARRPPVDSSRSADPANTSICGPALDDVTTTETVVGGAQCKSGGWKTMDDADGTPFKNQGDCVSFYATSGATPIGN